MGLFDLAAPLFGGIDHALGIVLPSFLRLILWGVFAGWLTMVAYRRLSNQEKINRLRKEQQELQKQITDFDGELNELLPVIKAALGTGFRQLGLAIGPALLATVPVLFVIAWVAGAFGYEAPQAGSLVQLKTTPAGSTLESRPAGATQSFEDHWNLTWPHAGETVSLDSEGGEFLVLPAAANVAVIHKRYWWNSLFGNPIGYLPAESSIEQLDIGLPTQSFLPLGPGWMRGWMFLFFSVFLIASLGFKFLLKIH